MTVTDEMVAAAWGAWLSEPGGGLDGMRRSLTAALAVQDQQRARYNELERLDNCTVAIGPPGAPVAVRVVPFAVQPDQWRAGYEAAREQAAVVADTHRSNDCDWDTSYWNNACESVAAAIMNMEPQR